MQQINYPEGHRYWTSGYSGGKFWVLTGETPYYHSRARAAVTSSEGDVYQISALAQRAESIYGPVLMDHPKDPGLSCGYATETRAWGVKLSTSKVFEIAKGPKPNPEERHYSAYRNMLRVHIWPHALRKENERLQRAAWDDRVVVMSGAHASGSASQLMGPTAAKGVLATKNLRAYRLVLYTRGEGHRVMFLGTGVNAIDLVLAPDGLTFLAACRKTAFVFDFDSEPK